MTTVLVVDDNPMDQRVAGACVEECGMSTLFAANGVEALDELDGADIVLTDLDMPELNGLELVRKLQTRAPQVPVILMTAMGSEDIAAEALKAGASSYVPKRRLRGELRSALQIVLQAARARDRRQNVYQHLLSNQLQFVIGNDEEAASSLVSHLQNLMVQMELCEEAELLVIGTALLEATTHAIDRGNLELDSSASCKDSKDYAKQRQQRLTQEPYRDRRVFVTACLTAEEAVFTVHHEGPGIDYSQLPDPGDVDNLTHQECRSLVLIQMFMDEVSFNDEGNELTLRLFFADDEVKADA